MLSQERRYQEDMENGLQVRQFAQEKIMKRDVQQNQQQDLGTLAGLQYLDM